MVTDVGNEGPLNELSLAARVTGGVQVRTWKETKRAS
jgi:hypothetical protein